MMILVIHVPFMLLAWVGCNWIWRRRGVRYGRYDGFYLGQIWLLILPMIFWIMILHGVSGEIRERP